MVALLMGCLAVQGATTALGAQPQQSAQDGFLPMDDVPAVVWAIAIGYLWTIWRRIGSVERELADVSRRVTEREGR